RPEIAGVNEIVLVRADPQFLRAGARLDLLERGDDAGLEDVEPGGDVKPGNVDRAAEIVPSSERVGGRMGDDLVQEGLPGREIGVSGERQPHPIGRADKGRVLAPRRIEALITRRGGYRRPVELRGTDAEAPHDRFAVRGR